MNAQAALTYDAHAQLSTAHFGLTARAAILTVLDVGRGHMARKKQVEYGVCGCCKERFIQKRSWQQFCSSKCKDKARKRVKPAALATPDLPSEESDDYFPVVARLTPDLRVICCQDDIQWIAQSRNDGWTEQSEEEAQTWSGFAFCGTKEGLLMRLPHGGYGCDPEAWAIIEALPPYFPKLAAHSGTLTSENARHAENGMGQGGF